MRTLAEDLEAAAAYHSHLCSGMVLGVRMARIVPGVFGINDPLTYRDLIVYVEMGRAASLAAAPGGGRPATPPRNRGNAL